MSQEQPASGAAQDAPKKASDMKDCFGVSFGWFMEDLVGDREDRERCYVCPDYAMCCQMSMIRTMTALRYEIRRSSQTVGRAVGGSHSTRPFG